MIPLEKPKVSQTLKSPDVDSSPRALRFVVVIIADWLEGRGGRFFFFFLLLLWTLTCLRGLAGKKKGRLLFF